MKDRPDSRPVLIISTVWTDVKGYALTEATLLDTGCSTSAVTSSFVKRLAVAQSSVIAFQPFVERATLRSATGGHLVAQGYVELCFGFGPLNLQHKFYVFDKLHYDTIWGWISWRETGLCWT